MSTSNLGNRAAQHPLQATAAAISGAMGEPRSARASHFMSANEGPADIAAKITGVNQGGKREDDSAYFTNNEGIPWPDPCVIPLPSRHQWYKWYTLQLADVDNRAHSKTVGGLPLVSDTFLLQKQQTFNRSKNLERELEFLPLLLGG